MLPVLLLLLLLFCCSASEALASHSLKLPLLHTTAFRSSLSSLSAPVVSGASAGAGQYFVHILIGTPPQPLRLVADTGSDLVWARCSPCRSHYSCPLLHPPGSTFLPRISSSFSPLHCYHPACSLLPSSSSTPCPRRRLHTPCRYHYSYADLSFSAGFFSRETALLNATSLPGLRFGCAFNVSAGSDRLGVLGLGRGPISFASQAARLLRLPPKFSYCLADFTLSPPPTSYLLIGDQDPHPPDLEFTPLQTNPLSPTFYYLTILSVTVGGVDLRIDPAVWAIDRATGGGGTIVDSGTTLSFVPDQAYRRILRSMRRRISRSALVLGPPGFGLCVNSSAEIPRLGFRMLGGAEFSPPPGNYFVDAAEGVRCLAVQAVKGEAGFGVIGNLMQQGFLIVFDRVNNRIGFSRTGCGVH